ncbi:uncharacterized protein LOC135841013 [Planococcus citri]|uniref:uncharacterized protein LOC135841013 n=1 Tax=Planococcus citri TaxID=170843 RepID=UPI0031F85E3B
MSSTTQKRRPISIHDYPEHLNPFSECHFNVHPYVPDKRKIIVDKLRKNGTWSSKISKRLNRSVSWIEKSWLQVDNSPRRVYESRICNDLHNNALYAKQSQVHNESMTRRESCSDVRHEIEATPHEYISNGNSMEKSKSVEHLNKCDTRRRKKRPAPLPPSAVRSSVTETEIVENTDQEKVTNDESETEEKISVSHEDEPNTSISLNEIPIEDDNLPNVPSETPITEVDESKSSDQIKIVRIEIDVDDEKQSKLQTSCEHDDAPIERDEKQDEKLDVQVDEIQDKMIDIKLDENQEKQANVQLDENANISSVKNENENCNVKTNQKTASLAADNEIHI